MRFLFTVSRAFKNRRDVSQARFIIVALALAILWVITALEILLWSLSGADSMTLRINMSNFHFALGVFWLLAILGSQTAKFRNWKAALGMALWGSFTIISPPLIIVGVSIIFNNNTWDLVSALVLISAWLVLWWTSLIFSPVWMLEIQPGEIYLYRKATAPAGTQQLIARESPNVSSELRKKLAEKFHVPAVLISSYLDYGTPEFIQDMIVN